MSYNLYERAVRVIEYFWFWFTRKGLFISHLPIFYECPIGIA